MHVAREAAELLYTGQEKEYKQAKLKARTLLGARTLPSNAEVATQLDLIAHEREGTVREERLIQMRQDAYQLMLLLKRFHPRLVGSVWRGTAHHRSDIDLIVYTGDSQEIALLLEQNQYLLVDVNEQKVTKKGVAKHFIHIRVKLEANREAEIVIHNWEDREKPEQCEIYGDRKTGLTIEQLHQVLTGNPEKRFTPNP
jgi:predicted nucleotidyltransferase